jgi:hypothetical protein
LVAAIGRDQNGRAASRGRDGWRRPLCLMRRCRRRGPQSLGSRFESG